jgi:hypothetical protein
MTFDHEIGDGLSGSSFFSIAETLEAAPRSLEPFVGIDAAIGAEIDASLIRPGIPIQVAGILPKGGATE